MKNKIYSCLNNYFGYSEFRPGQYEVIESILKGNDTSVIMPTGGGKSICFQIPAMIFEGVTIVISPLISLMKDQVDKLREKDIPCAFINSTMTLNETDAVINAVRNNIIKILYIAPERFNSSFFRDIIQNINVSFFAVDEAHCISEWGHDFRPAYLRLQNAIFLVKPFVIGAFTATATPKVRKDIISNLGLHNPLTVIKGFDRPNIKYLSLLLKEKDKKIEVLDIIKKVNCSTIVYCSTKKSTKDVALFLQQHGIEAFQYNGGIDKFQRETIQNKFMNNQIQVIVATNAFGMGIDKADIRLIIHYNLPGTIEAFYQESGRAGRDGKVAYSLLLGNRRDMKIQSFLIDLSFPTKQAILDIYRYFIYYPTNPVLQTYKDIAEAMPSKTSEILVGNVIKILEVNGLIKRLTEKNHPASVFFTKPLNRIIQRNSTYRTRKKILGFFLDEFSNDTENQTFSFSISKLLHSTGMTKEQFVRNIKNLHLAKDIHYSPPFSGKGIQKLQIIHDEKSIPVNFNKIEENRQRQHGKLDIVNEYVTQKKCKRTFLLNYFGEKNNQENCSGCDICLNWRQNYYNRKEYKEILKHKKSVSREVTYKKLKKSDQQAFFLCVLKYNNKLGLNKLVSLLKGAKESFLLKKDLHKCNYYGRLSQYSRPELSRIFQDEIRKGNIQKTKVKLYPKITITEKGRVMIKQLLIQ